MKITKIMKFNQIEIQCNQYIISCIVNARNPEQYTKSTQITPINGYFMCNRNQIVEMPLFAVDSRINWNRRTYPCEIDACLAPLLYKMNQKEGIVTTESCCGHGMEKGCIGIEPHSVYNAIKAGYNVIRYPRVWEREDGVEEEHDWWYIELPIVPLSIHG